MQNNYRFFQNTSCEYFPCHKDREELNCLFCYCPLYHRENCPGNPQYMEKNGKKIKICSNCTFPHEPENYETIIDLLKS
ncbi:MAG: metal-binding protein [Lachnospiraceae bacterium]|nr:metal-binding protein [Lachnospiraceae bacterium]